MWSGGGGGLLPPLPFSIRVAGVEEKQDEKERQLLQLQQRRCCTSGSQEPCWLAAAALQLVREGVRAVGLRS
jgi:hypothetical protein